MTFQRPDFVKRCMTNWSGETSKVIIADGSEIGLDQKFLSSIKDNVEYHHLNNQGLLERCRFLADKTATKYSMLHGDDEFFLPSSLDSQIEFLENNEGFVSCTGQCLSFRPQAYALLSEITYPELNGYEVSSRSPAERLNFHMKQYTPSLVYSVTKTRYWKLAFELGCISNNFSFWAGGEILVEMALAYLGKSKVIGTLGWLRSKENERIQGKGTYEKHESRFSTWWESDEMENERELFTQIFAEKMSEVNGRPVSEIKQEAWEGLKGYYEFSKNYHAGRHWFKRPESSEEPIIDLAEKLMESGLSVNLAELEDLRHTITDFHLRREVQQV
jgi:glycosyltransferase domain-containing protein